MHDCGIDFGVVRTAAIHRRPCDTLFYERNMITKDLTPRLTLKDLTPSLRKPMESDVMHKNYEQLSRVTHNLRGEATHDLFSE
jgi:hypothetical protein